jgi:hypothetical protein
MLALKQSLSLPSLKPIGEYVPPNIDNLIAWYKNQTGLTFIDPVPPVLVPTVSVWEDSSNNSHDMVQATASEQPTYVAGALTFVSANQQNLQTTSQISLSGDFTIGLRIYPSVVNAGTFLADNTTGGELFKYTSSTRISLKIDASSATALDLDEGTFGDDYLIITRSSNVVTLWKNGVAQTGTTPTLAGTADIDAIGIRRTDTDPFDGTIEEILIYDISTADLIAKLNTRLASL